MESASFSPDLPSQKKDSISFAPPPPELNLPRASQDLTISIDDPAREHPELSHRRSSSADGSGSIRKGRVLASPPPPPAYTPRVSFDTFDTKDATYYAYVLAAKHRMYRYHHSSRTFLLGLDHKDYSQYALEWGMQELFEDNDQIVILRVVDAGTSRPLDLSSASALSFETLLKIAEKSQVESEGRGGEKEYQLEAKRLIDTVIEQNKEDKALDVIVELVVGRFQDQVHRLIQMYSPDSLIVGTRGRDGAIGGLLPGSMSKYCLQHSPVPVIVVHPSQRRLQRKHKRQKDPERQSYIHLLKLAKAYSSSSESIVPAPIAHDAVVPEISLDTPGSLSPDEELSQAQSESQAASAESDVIGGSRPPLQHAITAPASLNRRSIDTEAALERLRDNASPAGKG